MVFTDSTGYWRVGLISKWRSWSQLWFMLLISLCWLHDECSQQRSLMIARLSQLDDLSHLFHWRISFGSMSKMMGANSICVLRYQSWWLCRCAVEFVAGRCRVTCMPWIFVHWIGLAKEKEIVAEIKHDLVLVGAHGPNSGFAADFKHQH